MNCSSWYIQYGSFLTEDNRVRASQETYHISTTEPIRLMLFGETVAVYCESHTEHRYTLCADCSPYLTGNNLRLRHRAQPVNAVWGNSCCLLWKSYGIHRYTLWAECNPYLTVNTLRLRYSSQPVNAVWGNSRCLLWEPHGTHKYTLWIESEALVFCMRYV
jgi:hypothetical protein